jgi:hypothetical protein
MMQRLSTTSITPTSLYRIGKFTVNLNTAARAKGINEMAYALVRSFLGNHKMTEL